MQPEFKKVVITGTGRSGTKFASKVLTAYGIPCGHQNVFTDHNHSPTPDWGGYSADASGFAAPHVAKISNDVLVIHQTRHPLLTIASMMKMEHIPLTGRGYGHSYISRYLDCQADTQAIVQAARIWVMWNEMVEQIHDQPNYIHFRLEDYDPNFIIFLAGRLGAVVDYSRAEGVLKAFNKSVGAVDTRTHPVRMEDIPNPLRDGVRAAASRYGYSV